MSKLAPKFYGTVTENGLKLNDPQKLREYSNQFIGKEVYITIKRKTKIRSNNQNSYYHGVVVKLIADHIGEFEPEKVHNMLRWMFLRDKTGNYDTVKSTTDLTTVEMEDYLSKCRMWANIQLGCNIPLPGEVDF